VLLEIQFIELEKRSIVIYKVKNTKGIKIQVYLKYILREV